MKLFNKTIDRQLFKQYSLGSDLSKQEVVVKIFNPTGAGNWFIVNSDPNDPDYLWAIVDLGYGAEVGSVSRSELENYRGRFGLGLERDLGFDPMNAEELYKGLRRGEYYADGGEIEVVYERRADFKKKPIKLLLLNKGKEQKSFTFSGKDQVSVLENYNRNKQEDLEKLWNLKGYESKYADGGDIENFSDNQRMIMNQNIELEHHHEELEDILEDEVPVPAWVVAKMATATQSVSDVTHYLDGQKEIMEEQFEEEDKDEEEDEEIKNKKVVEPIFVDSKAKKEMLENNFADGGNIEEFKVKDKFKFLNNNDIFTIIKVYGGSGDLLVHDQDGYQNVFKPKELKGKITRIYDYANGGETQELEVGKKYRAKNGDILTIKDFDIENHITIDDGKGKLSSIGIQRISVFKDLINDGELVPLNELGNFVNDVYAKGGAFEKVRWQDAEKGDSARVKELNRMGLITHIYGRKFNLKFPNGTEKTFDASDLEFFKLEKDQYEIDNHNNYAKGGKLDVVDLYNDYYIKGYENKAYQFAYVPEFLGKESVIAYSLGLEDGDKRNKKDYESFEESISKVEQKTNKPKYINHNDIKTVTLKRNGKEVTYKGDDVLNGANILADGGYLTSKANYVPKRDVVEVELKDGSKVKPVNGYWVNKGAEPIGAEPTPTSSGKSEPKIGETYIRKGVTGWKATTSVDNFDGHDWRISTFKSSRGDLITSAQGGKTEKSGSGGAEMFSFMLYQDPNHTLEVSKPSRLTEKVIAEQHAKGLAKFKKFMETGMFKGGGRISNFDKLSAKVAKQYEGKPVKNQYQEEYGKFYSKEEAKEVGDKVAGKVKALQSQKMMEGGATFAEKSKAIAKKFVGKKVEPKYQKDYGKVYDKQEAKEVGNKIAGSIVKKSQNGSELLKKANILAKQIRKDGESWNDAKRRAFTQLKK